MFKIHQRAPTVTEHRDTIDRLHNQHVQKLLKGYSVDKKLTVEEKKLEQKIQELKNTNTFPFFMHRKLYDYRERLFEIQQEKKKNESQSFVKYIANVYPILEKYYTNQSEYDQDADEKYRQHFGAFSALIQKTSRRKSTNKEALYHEYIAATRGEQNYQKTQESDICQSCKHNQFIINSESSLVCALCSVVHAVGLMENTKPGYKELQDHEYRHKFRYERSKNFSDCIDRAQGSERVEVPLQIIEDLRHEIHKRSMYRTQLTEKRVKLLLKHTGHNKYYKHVTHIRNILLGTSNEMKRFDEKTVSSFKKMFAEIQQPFEKYCPEDRSSFLSYKYVLRKFCELFELDETAKRFPYLKDRQKLRKHDVVWKKICGDVGYQFIPSL